MHLSLSHGRAGTWFAVGGDRIPPRTVILFTRQMATLLAAGLPILRSLETLVRQERHRAFRRVLADLADQVRCGSSFSQSLARHPLAFDHLLLSMVKAGEASGHLPLVLGRVADFREKSARVRSKLAAALIYPTIVMSVAAIIVGLLMLFVVPQFQEIFRDMLRGQPLPPLTQAVIHASHFIQHHWFWIGLGAVAVGSAVRILARTARGRRLFDQLLYWCPGPAGLVQRTAIARFARTFGTMVGAGVPLLEAIRITREVVGNAVVRDALDRQHDRVRDGDPLAAPMETSGAFPPMVVSLIGVGEETGKLPEMCDRIADAYEDEVDTAVTALTSIVEPVMIVVLAVFVGVIVIALFLPIVSIIQNLSMH